MPCLAQISGSNGKMQSTRSAARPDLLDALAAPGPDRGADEVDRLDAGAPSAAASRSRLKSGASTPMKPPAARAAAAARARCGCRRARGSGAALRRSRARELVVRPPGVKALLGHARAADAFGDELRPARAQAVEQQRRRAGRPTPRPRPSRSAESPGSSTPGRAQRAMPRVAAARKPVISAKSAAASGVAAASAAIRRRASSSGRPSR